MNYVINLYIPDIEGVNRTIIVNSNLPLQLFVKSLILSMNGAPNDLYLLEDDDKVIQFDDSDRLSSLDLKVGEIVIK